LLEGVAGGIRGDNAGIAATPAKFAQQRGEALHGQAFGGSVGRFLLLHFGRWLRWRHRIPFAASRLQGQSKAACNSFSSASATFNSAASVVVCQARVVANFEQGESILCTKIATTKSRFLSVHNIPEDAT
jgi:hypothetical protein